MLGREIDLPVDLMFGPHPQLNEFKDELEATQEHMQDDDQKHVESSRES